MHKSSLLQRAGAEFIGLFLMTSIGLMTVATAITTGAYGLFELSMAFAFTIMVIDDCGRFLQRGAHPGDHDRAGHLREGFLGRRCRSTSR